MFVKLKKGKQSELLNLAISKVGSERKLSKKLNISNGAIHKYKHEKSYLPLDRYGSLLHFLKKSKSEFEVVDTLLTNWRQIKGGKNCVAIKRKLGTLEMNLSKMRKASSKWMKLWHKNMKLNNPIIYYNLQYSRFKKVNSYKIRTKKGHLVRNILEKQVADALHIKKIDYEYEPLVKAGKRYYFPDFLIKNIVLECTMWKGSQNGYKLRKKIINLEKSGKIVFVIIPRKLYKYYSMLGNRVVFADKFASVAQTLLRKKVEQ